ncbi:hypothetical protein GCM10009646_79720 [Streptomyces aureus]
MYVVRSRRRRVCGRSVALASIRRTVSGRQHSPSFGSDALGVQGLRPFRDPDAIEDEGEDG